MITHPKRTRSVESRLCSFLAALICCTLMADAAAADKPKDAAKQKAKAADRVKEVEFSKKRGFYDAGFELRLSSGDPAAEIRYTLDGSKPEAARGEVYSKPLRIEKTAVLRAAAFKQGKNPSETKTQTYLFPRDIVRQSPDGLPPEGFPFVWGENRVDFGMDQRVVNDPAYKDEIIDGLKSIPSFSLVMDLEDLFHKERGIYSNPQRHGREAERAASLELIHADGRKGFQEDCGARIRGGFSRMPMNARHSFRFFFRKDYGKGKLDFPLFGEGGAKKYDGFDLRTSQNYSWSMGGDERAVFLRDQFSRDTQLAMGQPAARGDFCHLYINGQYWGLYNTCERPEAAFGEAYLGGKEEDYDTMKARAGEAGMFGGGPRGGGGGTGNQANLEMPFPTDGDSRAWKALYESAKSGLESNEAYQRLLGNNPDGSRNPAHPVLLDPANLIDYMLVILYGGNIDAPVSKFGGNGFANNWFGIRSRTASHGWKFFAWDAEHTLLDLNEDRTGPFACGIEYPMSNPQWIWQQCLANQEFRVLLADRVHRHFHHGGALGSEAAVARFLRRAKEIEKAVICESARWGDMTGGPFGRGGEDPNRPPRTRNVEWRAEVKRITEKFLPQRGEVVLAQVWNLGLYPDLAPVEYSSRTGEPGPSLKLALKADSSAIYYTLDGTDPRALGGKPSPTAKLYQNELAIAAPTTIKTRASRDGDWSPIDEVRFGKR